MGWDAKDIALLKSLWSAGQSAAQIARRLGCSRNAVCGMLTRLGLKRGHKPPTAEDKAAPEAEAGVVGSLRPSSRTEGVVEYGREAAAQGIQQAAALRHSG